MRSLLQEAPPAAVGSPPSNPDPPPFDSPTMTMIILLVSTTLLTLAFFSVLICRDMYLAARTPPPPPSNPDRPPMNCKGGVERSAVASLPVVAYGKAAAKHGMMSDDCPICLIEFEERECVKLIPHCGHVFHPTCIDTWLDTHVTCPVCRSAQLFKKVHEEVCLDVMLQDENEMMGRCEIGEPSTVGMETRGGTSL